ncbi:MAG: hypothetical protein WC480_00840 [Patescibacteria group bacterium]
MNDKIRIILDDLYAQDSSLRQHEETLIQLINDFLATKPDVQIDEQFIHQLRQTLLAKAQELGHPPKKDLLTMINRYRISNKLIYIASGTFVLALLVSSLKYGGENSLTLDQALNFDNQLKIEKAEHQAFGSLATQANLATTNYTSQELGLASAPVADGRGGGGTATKVISSEIMIEPGMMPPIDNWQPTEYQFIYKGEPIDPTDTEITVLKRIKINSSGSKLAQVLNKITFGLIEPKNFTNTSVDNVTISENKSLGYSVNYNFTEGAASISENYPKWQRCGGGDCQYQPLSPDDMLSDAVLIKLADEFLAQYKINMTNYGSAIVSKTNQRDMPVASGAPSEYYLPENITLVYPLKIDGQIVYNENGDPDGLQVNINLREKKVASVWNLNTQNYQASSYPAQDSAESIIQLAEQGGWRNYHYPAAPESKIVTIELGTPIKGLVRIWNYQGLVSDELLVPAYLFPITKVTGEDYYRTNVIVPLAKDLLINDVYPIPLLEKTRSSITPPADIQIAPQPNQ